MEKFIIFCCLCLLGCKIERSYYFSFEQYKQTNIRGYIQVDSDLIYPVTSYYDRVTPTLPDDAILIARGNNLQLKRIPVDSIKNYNPDFIHWPHRQFKEK